MVVLCKDDMPNYAKYRVTPGRVYKVFQITWNKDNKIRYLIANDANKPSYVPRDCFKSIGNNSESVDILYKKE